MRSGERGDFGQSHGRTTRLSLSLSLTWYTHREKNLALVKSGLYRSLGPRYMFGSCHAWNCSLEDIGGLSSFRKVPPRVKMQYARYPAVRRGVEGQQAGRARGDEEKANDFRAGETETRRQRTRHENEVQGDCAFPVCFTTTSSGPAISADLSLFSWVLGRRSLGRCANDSCWRWSGLSTA